MKNLPRNEYPRPQYKRKEWKNLNGVWNFCFDNDNIGEKEKWFNKSKLNKKINVPFSFESEASNIGDTSYRFY